MTYTVEEDAEKIDLIRRRSTDSRYAECDLKLLEITLDPALPLARKRETLLHEALHATFDTYGLKKLCEDGDDEEMVDGLGYALLDLIKNNPFLIRYLADDWLEEPPF